MAFEEQLLVRQRTQDLEMPAAQPVQAACACASPLLLNTVQPAVNVAANGRTIALLVMDSFAGHVLVTTARRLLSASRHQQKQRQQAQQQQLPQH